MPVEPPDALTERQRGAVEHPGGPLLVTGGAGTGKTEVLARRFAWLARERAGSPERVLMLVASPFARDEMCERLSGSVQPPYDELHVHTVDDLCGRLLADEALEAGLDPLFARVTRADRVALLLDRLGELTLRRHEIRGNPAPLLASFVERIDRLKADMVTPERCLEQAEQAVAATEGCESLAAADSGAAGSAAADPAAADETGGAEGGTEASDAERALAARELEFARLYADHDRLLAERGALDAGDLVLTAFRLLHEHPHVRERVARRFTHVLVDEYEELGFAEGALLRLLCEEHGQLTAAGDDAQRLRGSAHPGNVADFTREFPDATVVRLEPSLRCLEPIATAARAVGAPPADRPSGGDDAELQGAAEPDGAPPAAALRFWRCASERAQAQAVAGEAERLIAAGTDADAIAVLVRSAGEEGTVVGAALEERAVPFRVHGPAAYFQRAEVRDVLAWLRVLADPADSGAAVRALTRAPIELHSVDVARLTQLARRRKIDMPAAVADALEGPQLSPEGRDRAQSFLQLYRAAGRAFESRRPDAFVLRLVERIGVRRQQVFATQADTVERLRNIARLPELATAYMRREPHATPRDFTRYLKAVADSGLPEQEAAGPAGPPAVHVMAIDDAKGRQFDHVFLLGLSATRFPAAEPSPDGPATAGLPAAETPDSARPDSEGLLAPADAPAADRPDSPRPDARRLLNVATTRARRGLVLAWADASNGTPARPSPLYEQAREAAGADEQAFEEELFGPAEGLHSTFRIMRDELLDTVARLGGRLGEMRLDTTLDVSQGIARYLELVKVAALIERSKAGQPLDEAIGEVNQLLAAGASAEQRAVLDASALDDWLRDSGRDPERRPVTEEHGGGPSLDPFIPRRRGAGAPEGGLMLSASDIETYRLCPLKYKFARVFRIPQEATINQRFGIALHTVLERFHKAPGAGRDELFELFESSWRRGGFGDSDDELQFRERGIEALERYWENTRDQEGEPVWFERSFSFTLGPHVIRGRVDRVDRRPDGSYELIDYKTGRSKTPDELQRDIQLSIYQMGAREAWGIETSAHSYYYVMTAEKVPVAHSDEELDRVRSTIEQIGAGIDRQDFQPTPSQEICSFCDYRIICPAAER